MDQDLKEHLNKIFLEFTQEDSYDLLVSAKEKYFKLAGKVDEDDEDYEGRMRSFNEWYVLQYSPSDEVPPPILQYISKYHLDATLSDTFKNVNHSIFEYLGTNFRKRIVLRDILHNCKITLSSKHNPIPFVKGDLFVARILNFKEEQFLMEGMCVLPSEVKNILIKESKKIRKLDDREEEVRYLLKVESLKTKWLRYGHIEATKIFNFES